MKDTKTPIQRYFVLEKNYSTYVNRFRCEKSDQAKFTAVGDEMLYEDLYNNLTKNLEATKSDLGEFFFNKYVNLIKDKFTEIHSHTLSLLGLVHGENNEDLAPFLHYQSKLEKRINELLGEPQQPDNLKAGTTPADELNVFCKNMPLSIPKEHFKRLTEKSSKNGQPFLTQDQFDNFINRAFLGKKELLSQKMNLAQKGEKLKIQNLFYQFYENYSFDYLGTGQTKDIFVKLLTDNFIGWEYENVHVNFNKKPINAL